MSLRIRRGTDEQRTGVVFDMGEIVWTTDTKKLYVGDGITAGGTNIAEQLAGTGLSYNNTTGRLDRAAVVLNTDQVAEGSNNKYFTKERAQDAIGDLIAAGTQSGITVTYNDGGEDGTGAINFTVSGGGTGSLNNIVEDTSPQLGGNLDLNSFNVTGTGNINTSGTVYASSGLGGALGLNGHSITGTGDIDIVGTIRATTGLGGDLGLNGHNIYGTGNISTTGSIYSTLGLGGDLGLNSHNITGTGNINTTGNINVTGTFLAANGLGGNLLLNSFSLYDAGGGSDISISGLISGGGLSALVTNYNITPLRLTNIFSNAGGDSIAIRKARGTELVPTVVALNDYLSNITSAGYDGTGYVVGAAIKTKVTGSVTSGAVPTTLEFHTAGTDGVLTRRGFFSEKGNFFVNAPVTINTEGNNVLLNVRQVHANAVTGQFQLNRARGAITSPTAVQGQDQLGNFTFIGHDGTAERQGASIVATVEGLSGVNVSTNQIPTKLTLSVNPGTSGATPEAAVVINSNKVVDFKATALHSAEVDVAGGVVDYLKVMIDGVERAIPAYALV